MEAYNIKPNKKTEGVPLVLPENLAKKSEAYLCAGDILEDLTAILLETQNYLKHKEMQNSLPKDKESVLLINEEITKYLSTFKRHYREARSILSPQIHMQKGREAMQIYKDIQDSLPDDKEIILLTNEEIQGRIEYIRACASSLETIKILAENTENSQEKESSQQKINIYEVFKKNL